MEASKRARFVSSGSSEYTLLPEIWSKLPPELLETIVSMLPLKSVLQWRSVSKAWCATTRSPHFCDAFQEAASRQKAAWSVFQPPFMKNMSAELHVFDPTLNTWHSHLPVSFVADIKYRRGHVRLIASAIGLLCFSLSTSTAMKLYTYNPITKSHRELPRPTYRLRPDELPLLGFMFGANQGSNSNSYKILIAGREYDRDGVQTSMYDSSSNAWERCGNLPRDLLCRDKYNGNGVHLHGHLYFLSWMSYQLLAFDLNTLTWTIVNVEITAYLPIPFLIEHLGSLHIVGHFKQQTTPRHSFRPRARLREHVKIKRLDKQTMSWSTITRMPMTILFEYFNKYLPQMNDWAPYTRILFYGSGHEVYVRAALGQSVLRYDFTTNRWQMLLESTIANNMHASDIVSLRPSLRAMP